MDRERSTAVTHLVSLARDDRHVLAVLLFGSEARNEAHSQSDVDICIVLDAAVESVSSRTRRAYLCDVELDIHIFQEMPLHLRRRALKEGRILFCRDEDALYELAFRTAREYEDFRPIHEAYLEVVAHG